MGSRPDRPNYTLNEFAGVSKSRQIASAIEEAIREGELVPGNKLPTVNDGTQVFDSARKTVVKAYMQLIEKGLVESVNRRGYYVVNTRSKAKKRILLLIHSFGPQLQLLYEEFTHLIGKNCEIDLYFHHYNIEVLEMVINRNLGKYDYYLISSFNHTRIQKLISKIPRGKVLIVSRDDKISQDYYHVTQDFYTGTLSALASALPRLREYKQTILCYPEPKGHSETLKKGFVDFCRKEGLSFAVVESLGKEEIQRDRAYFVIEDSDLVKVLKCSKNRNWKLGKDIGVLAYNETPLKEVIRDGISVVSCDFNQMAAEMAAFIRQGRPVHKTIPIRFIQRNSV